MKHIGFIGASGLMGHGIAKNLLLKGFAVSLTVHRNQSGVADLLASGAKQVVSPADLGACDAVIMCVTGTPQVEAALLGADGLLSRVRAGLVVIDTSTSEPESTQRLAARCAQQGVTLVDAPLARSAAEAEAGKLNTMVGATPDVFAQVRPVLQAYCENIFHVGGPGSGHIIKLLNSFVAQAICTATAEAFAVGAKAGVDVQQLVSAAAGVDATRGDTIAVSAMAFDTSAATAAKDSLAAASAAEQTAKQTSLLKTAAMVLVVLFLMFLAWRWSRKRAGGWEPPAALTFRRISAPIGFGTR